MKRYIVKWHEKVRGVDSKYMCFKVEFVRKKEAEGMFNWLSYCKRKDPIRNVFIYDKESKKTIRRNRYVDRWVVVSTQRHTHDYVRKIYCEEEEANRVYEELNKINPDEYQVVKFKVRLKEGIK